MGMPESESVMKPSQEYCEFWQFRVIVSFEIMPFAFKTHFCFHYVRNLMPIPTTADLDGIPKKTFSLCKPAVLEKKCC
jgi:hypothetical protein